MNTESKSSKATTVANGRSLAAYKSDVVPVCTNIVVPSTFSSDTSLIAATPGPAITP